MKVEEMGVREWEIKLQTRPGHQQTMALGSNPACCLLLQIKIYWYTFIPIGVHIVYLLQ